MLWASDGPDGLPGVAAWDLYRAEDADLVSLTAAESLTSSKASALTRSRQIRDFLYETIAESEEDIRDAAEARMVHDEYAHCPSLCLRARCGLIPVVALPVSQPDPCTEVLPRCSAPSISF